MIDKEFLELAEECIGNILKNENNRDNAIIKCEDIKKEIEFICQRQDGINIHVNFLKDYLIKLNEKYKGE